MRGGSAGFGGFAFQQFREQRGVGCLEIAVHPYGLHLMMPMARGLRIQFLHPAVECRLHLSGRAFA